MDDNVDQKNIVMDNSEPKGKIAILKSVFASEELEKPCPIFQNYSNYDLSFF